MTSLRILLVAIIGLFSFTACSQTDETTNTETAKAETPTEPVVKQERERPRELHPYGGWYCPDNLGGFPPANVQMLDEIPVVEGRLPTRDETRNGSSLMYFDTKEVPNARSLDMDLPRLARYYTNYSEKEELVIIIQAVTAGTDTVVGRLAVVVMILDFKNYIQMVGVMKIFNNVIYLYQIKPVQMVNHVLLIAVLIFHVVNI